VQNMLEIGIGLLSSVNSTSTNHNAIDSAYNGN